MSLATPNAARQNRLGVGRHLASIIGLLVLVTGATWSGSSIPSNHAVAGREVHPIWRSIGPNLLRKVPPRFPRKAARAGLTDGMVIVHILIDTDGHTRDLQVIQSDPTGFGFEEAALRAVAKWRYEPLIANGEVKSVYLLVKVDFHRDRHEA